MPVLLDVETGLAPTTTSHTVQGLPPVAIGKPLAIHLLSFFPGVIKSDWGGRAELMITSQTRLGPSNKPAPRLVNMMLKGYDFRRAQPVVDYGGDVYGDRMFFYTKAYASQRVGITLRGVELDRVGDKTWKGITSTISAVGNLALFAPAAPYLAAAGLTARMAKTLVTAFSRNDRLTIQRTDLFFGAKHKRLLQAGRYVFWSGGPNAKQMARNWRLSGEGDELPNVVVSKLDGGLFRAVPYLVIQIDGQQRKEYDDFEIGAGSAELLEQYGDKEIGAAIFQAIRELAGQVNDARQLSEVNGLIDDLGKAETDEDKALIKAKIKAHSELFSEDNGDLLKTLLKGFLE
jgi:hypothetical protein